MKIPKEIKVGAHIVSIAEVSQIDMDNSGGYDTYYRRIRIRKDKDVPEDIPAEVLLHEICEAIKHFHNLEIDHNILTTLSEVLFQIIRDNQLNFLDTSI